MEAIHAGDAALQPGGLLVHLCDPALATFAAAESARTRPELSPDLAFNTAVSFTTNTNWQSYGGESTMSYFSQMVGLAFHNFVSAAIGIAIAAALVRGIARHSARTLGNFWVDLVRVTYYLLLPICLVFAVFLVSQGMIQNFKPYTKAKLVEPYEGPGGEEERRRRDRSTDADGKAVMEEQTVTDQNHRARADGLADRHQNARHEWRRLRERQRRASVRESDAAVELSSRCSRSSPSAAG